MSGKPLEDSAEEHLERVDGVLRKVHARRNGRAMLCQGGEISLEGDGTDWKHPLQELMEAEERAENEMAAEVADVSARVNEGLRARLGDSAEVEKVTGFLEGRAQEVAFAVVDGERANFVEWIFAEGPNPLEVVRRIFAYAKQKRPDLLWNMSFRELGDLLGETHATVHARCARLFKGMPAGWKKSPAACRNMSEAQRGNNNRRHGKRRPGATSSKDDQYAD